MKVGITATQKGMTAKQKTELRNLLMDYRDDITEFHHGDCIGGDDDAHKIAVEVFGAAAADIIWIHPGDNPAKRAFNKSNHVLRPKDNLERNRDIVDAIHVLIAAPKTAKEVLRSGTWATVRYAKKCRRALSILNP